MRRILIFSCISYIFKLSACCETGRIFFGSVNETYPDHIDKNGIYIRQLETSNNSPVYKHEFQDYYMYYVSGTLLPSFWVVGSSPGSLNAYLVIKSEAESPDRATGEWELWDENKEQWILTEHLHVKCVDSSFITCNTGKLSIGALSPWNIHQENRTGVYVLVNETYEMRPVYQHMEGHGDYLYYVDGLWMIGPEVGRVSAALFVLDYAWRPEYVVESWIVFNGLQFLKDTKFHVRCAGDLVNPLNNDVSADNDSDSDLDISSVMSIAEGVLSESDIPLPVCDGTWCQNDGICITNELGHFLCACLAGYFGTRCENAVDCGDPPEIENGYIKQQTGSAYHNLVFYACNDNFQLTGEAAVLCQRDGLWDNPPQCVDWLDYLSPGRDPMLPTGRYFRRHRRHRSSRSAPAITLQKMKAMF